MKGHANSLLKKSHWALYTYISLFLYGCASAPDLPLTTQQPDNWQTTIAKISMIDEWEISGKIGVSIPQRIDSAVINRWQQTGDHFTIDLSSVIFGLGSTTIRGTPSRITLTESGEAPVVSYNPGQLIENHIGWPLPITQLRYWIKGMPAPQAHAIQSPSNNMSPLQFDSTGRLSEFTQDGWKVQYSKYSPAGDISLPGKIVMKQQNTKITVVVNEWLIP